MPGDVTTATPAGAAGLLRTANADGGGAPVTTPRVPAREAAERELSKGEYHKNDPGLLSRFLDWLWDHISSLLNSAAQASPGGWAGLTVIILLVVLLAVALRLRLGKLRPGPVSEAAALFGNGPRSAAEHRTAAEDHAAAERWNQALQERMRAIVRSLEERALLDHRPGRTADEAAVEADLALPGHALELRAAARSFDEVTYAGRHVDSSAYEAVRDLDSALQRGEPPHVPDSADPHDPDPLAPYAVRASGADVTTRDGGGS
jgi:hypothetical protein